MNSQGVELTNIAQKQPDRSIMSMVDVEMWVKAVERKLGTAPSEKEQQEGPIVDSEAEEEFKQATVYKINTCFIAGYCGVACLGNVCMGWLMVGVNTLTPVFQDHFLWTDDESDLYNTLISTIGLIGSSIGSLLGGKILQYGRRKGVLIFDVVAMAGLGLMMIQSIVPLLIGRFIYGFGCGVLSTATTVIIGDMVPAGYSGTFGFLANLAFTAAAMMFAYGFDNKELYDSEYYWRITLGVPFLLCIVQIVVLGFVYKEDTVLYLIQENRKEEAYVMMKRVYHQSEDIDKIYGELKSELDQKAETAHVTLLQTLTDPKYRYATLFCMFLFTSAIQCGLAALLIYSTKIFESLAEDGTFNLTAFQATGLLGTVSVAGSISGFFPIRYFKFKPVLLVGYAIMTVSMLLMAILSMLEIYVPFIIFLMIFMFVYQTTLGTLSWLYPSEVLVDSANGIAVLTLNLMNLLTSLTTQYIVESPVQAYGLFFIYTFVLLASFVIAWKYMKETKGLSKHDKKELYVPMHLRSGTAPPPPQQKKEEEAP